MGYTYLVQSNTQQHEELSAITDINHAIRNITYATKFIKDIRHNLMDFRQSTSNAIQELQQEFVNEVIAIYKHILRNLKNKNPKIAIEQFVELRDYIRQGYEKFSQDIYAASGKDEIDDMATSSLLNVNRAFYLSNMAMLESLRVLLGISEEQVENMRT